jgi:ABC-type dipeptide/oligopeptide/nickel transport system permease component
MVRFILTRVVTAIGVIFGVSIVVFFLTFLSGDPALLMLPSDASTERIEEFREQRGYNDSIIVQYQRFARDAVQGDFGDSLRHNRPALPLVFQRLPATFQLTVTAMVMAIVLAIPLGILSATNRGKFLDFGGMFVALFGQSVPNFWFAIMLISLFSVTLGVLPSSGRGGPEHVILPAFAIAINLMALLTRLMRSSMLEILGMDYIRTARAKGLAERFVLIRHALRNSLIPLVTVIGLQFGYILGGAVVIETIFMWPGVGLLTIQAIMNRDFPVVQAAVFILASSVVIINLIVDITYTILDPRIKMGS